MTDDAGNKNNLLTVPGDQPGDQQIKAHGTLKAPAVFSKLQDRFDVPDEASRSSTPIEVRANTAAEVADTAEKLDRVSVTIKISLERWLILSRMNPR